jgi:MinD-like ATPase involved in chromosome partitioning or flagellar assembly
VLNVNDQMKVMIIDLDAERGRISLSTKALEPEPGDMLTDPQKVFDKAEEMAARYKQMLLEQAEEGDDSLGVMPSGSSLRASVPMEPSRWRPVRTIWFQRPRSSVCWASAGRTL